ncbi:MAG: 1,6-anhydro-N-acetylmuramyl-L-alanine amidase AmpD [Acidiferrobacterales bacterium]
MNYDVKTGLVDGARQNSSPNYDKRPDASDIDTIVIHAISLPPGEFGSDAIEKFFCNQLDHSQHPFYAEIEGACVSAHLLITRQGELVQFVPLIHRAWHAGVSHTRGRQNVNDFSIGIELEGCDEQPFEEIQYERLAEVTRLLIGVFSNLTLEHVYGHSDVAPGRKTDPGPEFDWQHFRNLCQQST